MATPQTKNSRNRVGETTLGAHREALKGEPADKPHQNRIAHR